jgi:hypothetical protein
MSKIQVKHLAAGVYLTAACDIGDEEKGAFLLANCVSATVCTMYIRLSVSSKIAIAAP